MRIYNKRQRTHADIASRAHGEMSEDTKMGLLLSLIGLVAFGAYAVFFLIGFVNDLGI